MADTKEPSLKKQKFEEAKASSEEVLLEEIDR